MLYIFWFLHQTTTVNPFTAANSCCISFDSYIKPQLFYSARPQKGGCISFDSYIKPQLWFTIRAKKFSCISFDSYIKPQLQTRRGRHWGVVYLLIPTSNHNSEGKTNLTEQLYIFWFLHQTTTQSILNILFQLLYIFWFLHQTTTAILLNLCMLSCISFDSYIKPQRWFYLC